MASAKELAYKRVFGITDEALQSKEVQKAIESATTDVMSYMGLYAGETPLQRDKRLEIESALNGESVELADYFKELYPDRFAMSTSWDIIFSMLKDMNAVGEESREEVVQALMGRTVGVQQPEEESTGEHLINTDVENKGGNETMSDNLNAALDNLSAAGGLTPQNAGGAKPTAIDDATKKAAAEAARSVINNDKDARIAFTKAAKVTKGIAMQPSLAKRVLPGAKAVLIKDGSAETAQKKADKIWDKFVKQFGRRVTDDGHVVYDNVFPGDEEAAAKLEAQIKKLQANPTASYEMAEPSTAEQLKGGYLISPDKPEETPMTSKELLQVMIEKTLGRLNTGVPESQFVVRKAINRVQTAGAQGAAAVATNADPWKGVAIVSVVKKAEFANQGYVYAYELDNTAKVMTPVRLKLDAKARYKKNGDATEENGSAKGVVFTISAFAEAHGTALNPDLKKFERVARNGVSSDNSRVLDFNSAEDVEKSMSNFGDVIASYLAANKGNVPTGASKVFQDAADMMSKNAASATAAEMEQMGAVEA